MPIGSGIVYNTGDLILSQVSSSGTAFLETKIAAATSSLIYFDSTARINSASLNSITVGTASYVSGSRSIITNLTASNISASGTSSFGIIGIGTVNPAYKLDVNGNANFTNGFYTNTDASSTSYFVGANGTRPIIFQNNTGASYDFGFKFSDSNTFTIVGGNTLANPTTDLVSFTYDGKVGIGTTVPSALLHIYTGSIGSTAYPLLIDNSSGGAGVNVVGFGFANGGIMKHSITTAIYGNDYMAFNVGQGASYNQERMRIDSTGNVGIGTTTVSRKLHAYITTGPVMRLQSSGSNASIEFIPSIGHNRYNWLIGAQQNISDAFEITPSTATNGTTFSNPAILVKSDGNVGIGITSPTVRLHVSGSSIITNPNPGANSAVLLVQDEGTATTVKDGTTLRVVNNGSAADFSVFEASSAASNFVILNNGNVGIGTTAPAYKLDVSGDLRISGSSSTVGTFKSSASSCFISLIDSSNDNVFLGNDDGDFLIQTPTTSYSTKLIVKDDGNVGIGTTLPASRLHVDKSSQTLGSSTPSGATIISNLAGGNAILELGVDTTNLSYIQSRNVTDQTYYKLLLNPSGGSVGIGTTSPAAKLQVAGNISGSSFTSSISNAVGFLGTSSWAQNVVSASFATTAQTANALNASNTYTVAGLTSAYVDVNGSSAPTTGIYRPSTKTLGLSADSTLIFKISNVSTPATSSIETGNFLVSGSVGIGTTSPIDKLDLNSGNIRLSDNYKLYNGSSNDSVGIYFSNTLQANIAGYSGIIFRSSATNISSQTERMRITSDGNVGIGTTVPSGSLTVQSNANQLRLQTTSGPGAYFTEISSRYDSTHPFQLGVANNSSTATEFFGIYADSGGSNNRSVFPTGNVGIGTTSPNSKLEVAGGSGTAIVSVNNTSVNRSGSFGIDNSGVFIRNSNDGDYFDLKNASGTARFRVIYDNATHLTTNFVSIGNLSATGSKLSVFGNLSVGSTYGSTAAPSNGAIFQGSVGIGTTSPDSSLHVYSTSFEPTIRLTSTSGSVKTYGLVNNPYWATGSFHIYDFTTDNSRIHISSGGNIGIAVGAATPANRLDIVGDLRVRAAGAAMILDTATTSDGRMEYKYNGTRKALIGVDSDNLQISADSGNFLQFRTNNTQRMIINNSGGVGIGTSSPLYLVDIYDTGANSAMMSLRSSGSGNARIYFDAANGDLVGSDYCYLGQEDNTLDFIINTSIAAGNIHLQPKSGGNTGILYVSGSTRFGIVSSQTHQFTGSVSISGSLNATASWSTNALTASFLPVGTYNITSSWANNALTASSLVSANSYTITNLTANNISASAYTGSSAYLSNIGFSDQTVASDTSIFPTGSTSGGLILDGGVYTNGLYRTRFVKIDRSANLSLYIQETKGSSGSFSNLVRFGTHANSPNTFEVFGSTNIQGSITSSNFVGPLIGNTTGTASWSTNALTASSVTSTSNAFIRGGNSFGANAMLGLNDNFRLDIETNGVAVISLTGSNVGIGTTSPIDKLHVSGSITAGTNTSTFGTTILQGYYTAGSLTVLGTEQSSGGPVLGYAVTPSTSSSAAFLSSTSITIPRSAYTQDGGTHRWYIGASQTVGIGSAASLSEVMRINSSGNIGIGTTVPTGRLNIASTSQTTKAIIQSVSAATGLGGYLAFNPGGDSTYSKVAIGVYDNYFSSFNRGNIAFMINSAADATEVGFTDTKMYISASGNVGIGTTNPVAKLQVAGNVSGSSFTSSVSNAVGFLGTSSWAQNVVSASFATTAQTANALNASNTYTIAGLTSAYVDVTGAGTIPTTGIYRPSTKTLGLSADGTLIFKISNVSAPATSSIETGNFLVQTGNVGIGTTNPTDKLTVYGALASYKNGADTIQTQVYLANGGNTRAFNLQLNSGGTGLDLWSYNSANAWLRHTTFDYDGRVGIGTAAPAAKLEISGSSNSALLHVKSPISGAILYVSGSGAVGINTSTVGAFTLQVNGSFGATTKSFIIDHPTKAGKKLMYGSLESPYHGIRLTGRDTLKEGKCKIQLPDYIYKLILHDSVNIQLTGIKCNKTLYVDEINIPENYFTIAYDKAIFESYKDYDFFWDFTAIRADVPELITEL